jgi:hypothetical protein
MKKPTINTRPYTTSHGKNPRGYGSWAFCPDKRAKDDDYLSHTEWFKGTYGEAAKQAREHFAGKTSSIACLP